MTENGCGKCFYCWPPDWKRTKDGARLRARFNKSTIRQRQSWADSTCVETYRVKGEVTIVEGTRRVLESLRKLGAGGEAIISSNLALRLDGLPRGGQSEPDDPGVAVYWKVSEARVHKVMAIDQYDRVADNLAAIAATLEAMRAIERHGGAIILERAFVGFDALPSLHDWRHILGFKDTPRLEQVRTRYRELAFKQHPDRGGSEQRMAELNRARQEAERELSGTAS